MNVSRAVMYGAIWRDGRLDHDMSRGLPPGSTQGFGNQVMIKNRRYMFRLVPGELRILVFGINYIAKRRDRY